jgi:SNF family Na+-dependent transporter
LSLLALPKLTRTSTSGGAFLVPYFLMVFIVGLPLFFAELIIGQYSGLGPIKAFTFIAPLFKGWTTSYLCYRVSMLSVENLIFCFL